ncbi:MAG: phosphoribosylglycinamide formyltransferase [Clostridia bacterium]|nr:phosphoribosylglycinamide formyltransferase [Clostridia bacterium]MBQ8861379.1 phosphoribosylglycinamide formyltransferase [Clostridia bacterium]
MNPVKIAVLVSGGGTNLQALIDAEKAGIIKSGKISLVVSSSPTAYALERAKNAGIETAVADKHSYANRKDFEEALIASLEKKGIELIVLAGFMYILSPEFIAHYRDRMINVHPSLIPSFCGDGFYGLHVHEAALAYGVKVTGATVHFVNEITDGGKIIMQKAVEINEDDTPETLQKRVMQEAEWIILPRAVEKVSEDILTEE